ncbi:MAG: hypothetical protein V4494_03900 [Chlamydiota bacterium]
MSILISKETNVILQSAYVEGINAAWKVAKPSTLLEVATTIINGVLGTSFGLMYANSVNNNYDKLAGAQIIDYPIEKKTEAFKSVMEFASKEVKAFTQNNINKIENLSQKLTDLKNAVEKMEWNAPIFEIVNHGFEGIEQKVPFEYPFVAFYGLRKGIFSENEAFLILTYNALCEDFSKEQIQFHDLDDADGKILDTLYKSLCVDFNSFAVSKQLPFSIKEFWDFIQLIKIKKK